MYPRAPLTQFKILQEQVKAIESDDDVTRYRLFKLNDDINSAVAEVEKDEPSPDFFSNLQGKLETAIEDFAESHPQVADQLRKVVNTMAKAGI